MTKYIGETTDITQEVITDEYARRALLEREVEINKLKILLASKTDELNTYRRKITLHLQFALFLCLAGIITILSLWVRI